MDHGNDPWLSATDGGQTEKRTEKDENFDYKVIRSNCNYTTIIHALA